MILTVDRTSIHLVRADITTLRVDAIVNAAHEALLGGGGVDGAIHRRAGPRLLQACREIQTVEPGVRCRVGEAHITEAFNLPCRHVIHTVAPKFIGGIVRRLTDLGGWTLTSNVYKNAKPGTDEDLANCYYSCLRLADQAQCKSLAFPSLGTGGHAYPIEVAAPIALNAIKGYVEAGTNMTDIYCVCFSDEDLDVYESELGKIQTEGTHENH